MSKKISCGVLIKTTDRYLLGHATNTKHWDILKGCIDPNETPLEAAFRECREESGIDLTKLNYSIIDLGQHAYKKEKDLHVFLIELTTSIDVKTLKCESMVQHKPDRPAFPEIDAFILVPEEEIQKYVTENLWAWLKTYAFTITQPITDCDYNGV